MVFDATFNNISVISWRSVLLVEKITDPLQVTDKLYHIMHQVYLVWTEFKLTNSVVIGTDTITTPTYYIGNGLSSRSI